MTLYMKTTKDRFELPLIVADSPKELAQKVGTTKASVLSALSHKQKGWARVKIEEDESNELF